MNEGKHNLTILYPNSNFEVTYTYKNKSKKVYYYQCQKRPKCKGLGIFNFLDKTFYISKECNDEKLHNKLSYERFNAIFVNNEYHKIDFSLKHNQVNLIKYIINNSENLNPFIYINGYLTYIYILEYYIKE